MNTGGEEGLHHVPFSKHAPKSLPSDVHGVFSPELGDTRDRVRLPNDSRKQKLGAPRNPTGEMGGAVDVRNQQQVVHAMLRELVCSLADEVVRVAPFLIAASLEKGLEVLLGHALLHDQNQEPLGHEVLDELGGEGLRDALAQNLTGELLV